jgi:hypothetical protein
MNVTQATHVNTQAAINQDWLKVLAFGIETPAIQLTPRSEPAAFEVLP